MDNNYKHRNYICLISKALRVIKSVGNRQADLIPLWIIRIQLFGHFDTHGDTNRCQVDRSILVHRSSLQHESLPWLCPLHTHTFPGPSTKPGFQEPDCARAWPSLSPPKLKQGFMIATLEQETEEPCTRPKNIYALTCLQLAIPATIGSTFLICCPLLSLLLRT